MADYDTSQRERDVDSGRLEGKLDAVAEQVAHIDKMLMGNGQKGLLEKSVAMEIFMTTHCTNSEKAFAEISESLIGIKKDMGGLTKSVEAHHNDTKLHSWIQQITWKQIIPAILVVIALVVTIPADFSLWNLIAGILKLK